MELLLFFALFLIGPGIPSFALTKMLPNCSRLTSLTIVLGSAGAPTAWVAYATQQADGITRAAGASVTPVLFFIAMIPAGLGFALAKAK
jgi:hypothetical protein